MKKILSLVGVAVVTILAQYTINYLRVESNRKELVKSAKSYSTKLEKSAKLYSKKVKKLYSKKLKEYKLGG